jgi:tetratricopeptide (TPR) repeat protein
LTQKLISIKKEKIYLEGIADLSGEEGYRLHYNYAHHLHYTKKDYDKAEQHYLKALAIDPDSVNANSNYANLLFDGRKDYEKAEQHYLKTLEIDPDEVYANYNYAMLLSDIRKDYDKAEMYFQVALKQAPNDENANCNYAKHLIVQHKFPEAKSYIDKAFELNKGEEQDLDLELHFYRYACFFDEYPEAKTNIKTMLEQGSSSPGWYLDNVIEVAKSLNHPCD